MGLLSRLKLIEALPPQGRTYLEGFPQFKGTVAALQLRRLPMLPMWQLDCRLHCRSTTHHPRQPSHCWLLQHCGCRLDPFQITSHQLTVQHCCLQLPMLFLYHYNSSFWPVLHSNQEEVLVLPQPRMKPHPSLLPWELQKFHHRHY